MSPDIVIGTDDPFDEDDLSFDTSLEAPKKLHSSQPSFLSSFRLSNLPAEEKEKEKEKEDIKESPTEFVRNMLLKLVSDISVKFILYITHC